MNNATRSMNPEFAHKTRYAKDSLLNEWNAWTFSVNCPQNPATTADRAKYIRLSLQGRSMNGYRAY